MYSLIEVRRIVAAMRGCLLGGCVSLVVATNASADLASDIAADLMHPSSGVPVSSVTVAAPDSTEALIGPGPNLQVVVHAPAGTPLRHFLVPTGAVPLFTTTVADSVGWDMAIMEAANHAVARGNAIESISIVERGPGFENETEPAFIRALPPYEQPVQVPTTMPLTEVRDRVESTLPPWAAAATVAVVNDAAQERVVTARLAMSLEMFKLFDPGTLLQGLVAYQREFADDGARIGRVVVRVSDPTTGDPLYAGAADSYIGSTTQWYSPLVWGILGELAPSTDSLSDTEGLLP